MDKINVRQRLCSIFSPKTHLIQICIHYFCMCTQKTNKMFSGTTKKQWLILFILSSIILLYNIWLLPYFDVTIVSENLILLDLLSSYTLHDVNKLFVAIGAEGMLNYKYFLIIDTTYILFYTYFLVYLFSYLLNNSGRLGIKIYLLRWLPLFVGCLDLIENVNILILLSRFPHISEVYANFGSIITSTKWYSVSVMAGIMICLVFYISLRNTFCKLKNKISNQL